MRNPSLAWAGVLAAEAFPRRNPAADIACSRQDTPPEDSSLPLSRQVSWLAGRGGCQAFPALVASGTKRQPLAAYSCGGSPGLAAQGRRTGFPLSPRYR